MKVDGGEGEAPLPAPAPAPKAKPVEVTKSTRSETASMHCVYAYTVYLHCMISYIYVVHSLIGHTLILVIQSLSDMMPLYAYTLTSTVHRGYLVLHGNPILQFSDEQ